MTGIKNIYSKILYKIFILLSLTLFFFSTAKFQSMAFDIENIEISRPFELNFDKNKVIDDGFDKAFSELMFSILNSTDQKKINQIEINQIKGMIDSFSIKKEKFIDEVYFMNIDVSFNKKAIYRFLEKKNIFPSAAIKKKFLFIPVIIDENTNELFIFYKNDILSQWNENKKNSDLIEYILPTEDLEDINLIKNNFENIEKYDFNEVFSKYSIEDYIIALIFKNNNELRILSRINVNNQIILKNKSFSNLDIKKNDNIKNLIEDLKVIYEDYWKNFNLINTSIKLPINIKVQSLESEKISDFEKKLRETDLVYDFFIYKIDKNFVYYKLTFNGTATVFLKMMSSHNYNFDTQNKLWILK